jgi:hypothetical protein
MMAKARLTLPQPLTCPQCGERIDRRQLKEWVCPFCHADIGVARSYQRYVALLTFASTVLLGVATHKPTSDGTWLLAVILSSIPLWIVFFTVIPPWLSHGRNQPRITLISSILSVAVSVFVVEFLVFGAAHVLLGASQQELREHLEMLSLPLAWISSNFLITPDKSFLHVCGVILGNSFFLGPPVFACYQSVRWVFRRSRPTRLSISDNASTNDEED